MDKLRLTSFMLQQHHPLCKGLAWALLESSNSTSDDNDAVEELDIGSERDRAQFFAHIDGLA